MGALDACTPRAGRAGDGGRRLEAQPRAASGPLLSAKLPRSRRAGPQLRQTVSLACASHVRCEQQRRGDERKRAHRVGHGVFDQGGRSRAPITVRSAWRPPCAPHRGRRAGDRRSGAEIRRTHHRVEARLFSCGCARHRFLGRWRALVPRRPHRPRSREPPCRTRAPQTASLIDRNRKQHSDLRRQPQ